jgi:hypothetical protein
MRLTKMAFLLVLVGVAIGLLLARFVLPNLGPLSGLDDSALAKPVTFT